MSTDRQSERHGHDGFAEFTEELRLLAEVLLARVEPVLRRTAADGQTDLGGCAWCPVCAAAALVRGDHHDVVAALADHGTSMVTVLREALAGIPVEPVLPPEWSEHGAPHHHSADAHARAAAADNTEHGRTPQQAADADPQRAGSTPPRPRVADPAAAGHDRPVGPGAGTAPTDAGARTRWGTARQDAAPRPRRVDEYGAPRPARAPSAPHIAPESGAPTDTASSTGAFAPTAASKGERRRPATEDRSATTPRAQYVDIPVTIRG